MKNKANILDGRISISPQELAQITGLGLQTIYRWTYERRIPYVKVGRRTLFMVDRIIKWLEERSIEARN